jgi:flagellar hook-length control protein FliK
MRAGQPGTPAAAVVDNGSAWPAAWVGAASTVGAAGGAPAASMPTSIEAPVGSAAFAAEAGYRIAVLVQGGVERAELQLNPVDMGPVTVQIAIDGLTAQVQLQAVQADTRQALEAAMPQLASQLSDAGLTLTGGGVFEQPQQQGKPQDAGSGNPEPGSRRNSDGRNGNDNLLAEQAGPARGSAVRLQRGMVDLVA